MVGFVFCVICGIACVLVCACVVLHIYFMCVGFVLPLALVTTSVFGCDMCYLNVWCLSVVLGSCWGLASKFLKRVSFLIVTVVFICIYIYIYIYICCSVRRECQQ